MLLTSCLSPPRLRFPVLDSEPRIPSSTPLVHVALAVVQLLFASLAIVGRYVLPEFPAGGLMLARVVGAAGVLVAVNAIRGGPWVTDRRDLLALAGLGTLGIALNQTLFIFGLRHTTAINATILQLDNGYLPIYQR